MAQIVAMSQREYLDDKEAREHGEYRTKRLVLKRCDALAIEIVSGKPCVSPWSPPPGGPRAALPPDRQDAGERKRRGG